MLKLDTKLKTNRKPMPRDKAELMERVVRARQALEGITGELSEGQMTSPRPGEGWSIKDHLAHLAAWERGLAALLQRRPRYAGLGLDEATYLTAAYPNDYNKAIYRRNKDLSVQEALDLSRRAHAEALSALQQLSYDDLYRTYSYFQPDEPGEDSGGPILDWIVEMYEDRYPEHTGQIQAMIEAGKK